MAIDADLNQRLITEPEAKEKRAYLNMETEFYGAMDGAGKFVKGDVLFTVLLAVVNIVFGLIVGMVQGGLSFGEAAVKYTELTIGGWHREPDWFTFNGDVSWGYCNSGI